MRALGIDFGTSHTVAAVRDDTGATRSLLFDGSPLLPSAVFLDADGRLLAGGDAVRSARLDPARFEPHPKRRIDPCTRAWPTGLVVIRLHPWRLGAARMRIATCTPHRGNACSLGPRTFVHKDRPAGGPARRA